MQAVKKVDTLMLGVKGLGLTHSRQKFIITGCSDGLPPGYYCNFIIICRNGTFGNFLSTVIQTNLSQFEPGQLVLFFSQDRDSHPNSPCLANRIVTGTCSVVLSCQIVNWFVLPRNCLCQAVPLQSNHLVVLEERKLLR